MAMITCMRPRSLHSTSRSRSQGCQSVRICPFLTFWMRSETDAYIQTWYAPKCLLLWRRRHFPHTHWLSCWYMSQPNSRTLPNVTVSHHPDSILIVVVVPFCKHCHVVVVTCKACSKKACMHVSLRPRIACLACAYKHDHIVSRTCLGWPQWIRPPLFWRMQNSPVQRRYRYVCMCTHACVHLCKMDTYVLLYRLHVYMHVLHRGAENFLFLVPISLPLCTEIFLRCNVCVLKKCMCVPIRVCVYIHIYRYIHICIIEYIHTYMYVCICLCVLTYTHIHVYIHVSL
jgi:hypothetical protein